MSISPEWSVKEKFSSSNICFLKTSNRTIGPSESAVLFFNFAGIFSSVLPGRTVLLYADENISLQRRK